jgi:hypothetical protein
MIASPRPIPSPGFGRFVRFISPESLADGIEDECAAASNQDSTSGDLRLTISDGQPALPFLFNQLASA